MTVANPYIARARIQSLRRYLPVSPNLHPDEGDVPKEMMLEGFEYIPTAPLSEDRKEARRMMAEIQEIRKDLPDLDCGSCGAPSCAAFAEDIIRGEICADECVVFMRKVFHDYLSAHPYEKVTPQENKNNGEEN